MNKQCIEDKKSLNKLNHVLKIMRITLFFLFFCILFSSAANSFSQNFTINLKSASIKDVCREIEKKSDFIFVFSDSSEKLIDKKVNINADSKNATEILDAVLSDTGLAYRILDKQIVVYKSKETVPSGSEKRSNTVSDMLQQTRKQISGKVIDAQGEPIIGANIVETGTTNGTVTDIDGNFSLQVENGASLRISYIGYLEQNISTAEKTIFNIILQEDTKALSEIVVVGYGTMKKKDLTGAITQIDNRMIEVQNQSSASKILEGTVPGVNIAAIDGQPGLDVGIRIRGLGSTNINSSSALVVIDGVPAQGENPLSNMNSQDIASVTVLKDAASTALYGSRGANGVVLITTKRGSSGKTKISFQTRFGVNTTGDYDEGQINDAASHYEYVWRSIYNSYRYGMNGTGGPILGQNGEYRTNIKNPNYTHEQAAEFASQHLFNYLGQENVFGRNILGNYMAYYVPGAIYTPDGTGTDHSSTMSGSYLVNTDGRLNPAAKLLYNDQYADALLQNNLRQEYILSATGGTDKTNYYMSLGYLSDPSFIPNSSFNRISGRTKLDATLFSWLKTGANVAYVITNTNYVGTFWAGRNYGSAVGNVMRYVNGHSPIVPVYQHDETGNFIRDKNGNKIVNYKSGSTYSPLGNTGANFGTKDMLYAMDNDVRQDIVKTINVRTYAEIPFLKYFTFRIDLSMDNINTTQTRYLNGFTGRASSMGGYFGKRKYETQIVNIQNKLSYERNFEAHHLDAMVLYEYNDYNFERVSWGAYQELIPNFLSEKNFVGRYGNAGSSPTPGYTKDIERMKSFLARTNYIFADKYYLSGSIRTDGSSKFKYNEDRWGTFWSVGAGWRFTEESFFENIKKEWFTNGKLRGSYGIIGNQNAIGRYSGYQTWTYGTTYTTTSDGKGHPVSGGATLRLNGLVNDRLTWENTKTFDIGLDLSFIDRIDITFDYYNRLTDNSFYNQPVSMLATGQSSLQQNIAEIRNRGFEIDIHADIIRNKDFHWRFGINATHYNTILSDLPQSAIPKRTEDLPEGTWLTNEGGSWSAAGFPDPKPYRIYLRGVGRDWYNLYLYKYAGVDQETGLPMYWHRVTAAEAAAGTYGTAKEGSDVKTNNYAKASRYEVGDALPDIIGGFNTSLTYRNFNLSANFAFQLGGKMFNKDYAMYLYNQNASQAYNAMLVSKDVVGNTWSPDNVNAYFPMQLYPTSVNGFFIGSSVDNASNNFTDMCLFSASYMRVKNVTLNYNLPRKLLDNHLKSVSGARFFISGDNLAIFSARKAVDPSMSATGGFEVDNYRYPNIRSFTVGVNIDF